MRSADITINVSGRVDGLAGDLEIAATVHLPDQPVAPVTVIFGYPGSGLGRRYFDVQMLPGYSQAEYHTAQGSVFVACDFLGTGESTHCNMGDLTFEVLAQASHVSAESILDLLRSGSLAADIPPLDIVKVTGIGQSMGGCVLTVQQANHSTFDAIAPLGWSAVRETVPFPDGTRFAFPGVPRDTDLRAFAKETSAATAEAVAEQYELLKYFFHWEGEETELVEADLTNLANDPTFAGSMPSWRVTQVPPCCAMMTTEHVVGEEAAAISVPVLIALGERDAAADPWMEVPAYHSSSDVALFVVPQMGHMHNFARTRELLWHRISQFAQPAPVPAHSSTDTSLAPA